MAQLTQGLLAAGVDGKAELAGETHRPQHPHRVLAVAPLRVVPNDAQPSGAQVFEAVGVVEDGEVGVVIVEGVDREVPPQGVLLDGPIGVVAHDQPVLYPAVGLRNVRVEAAEGRHLDDLGPKVDMGEAETPPDQTAVAKDPAHFLGLGIGGHVEVLGLAPEEEVADPAAHQMGLVPGLAQTIQDLQGVRADVGPGDVVLGPGNDPRPGRPLWRAGRDLRRSTGPGLAAGGGVRVRIAAWWPFGRDKISFLGGHLRGSGDRGRCGAGIVHPEEALGERCDALLEGWWHLRIIPAFSVSIRSLRLVVRTLASHVGNRGSNPLGSAK